MRAPGDKCPRTQRWTPAVAAIGAGRDTFISAGQPNALTSHVIGKVTGRARALPVDSPLRRHPALCAFSGATLSLGRY